MTTCQMLKASFKVFHRQSFETRFSIVKGPFENMIQVAELHQQC